MAFLWRPRRDFFSFVRSLANQRLIRECWNVIKGSLFFINIIPASSQIEEDDPEKYKEAVAILTTKLFADLERKRRLMEDKISEDAQKKREAELEAEERKQIEKEFNKNWEESRQGRVNSWLSFTGKVPAASGEAAAPAAPPAPPTTARVEGAFGAAPLPQMPAQSRDLGASAAVKVKKKKEKRFSPMGFRPPKHKPESR